MCGMFHFLVYTLGKVVSRVSESFPSKGKKKRRSQGVGPPIQKVRSAHEGERAESRRGWVLVCDRVRGPGTESWFETLRILRMFKKERKCSNVQMFVFKCSSVQVLRL